MSDIQRKNFMILRLIIKENKNETKKRTIGVILLAILLTAALFSGCSKKTDTQEQETSKPAETSAAGRTGYKRKRRSS